MQSRSSIKWGMGDRCIVWKPTSAPFTGTSTVLWKATGFMCTISKIRFRRDDYLPSAPYPLTPSRITHSPSPANASPEFANSQKKALEGSTPIVKECLWLINSRTANPSKGTYVHVYDKLQVRKVRYRTSSSSSKAEGYYTSSPWTRRTVVREELTEDESISTRIGPSKSITRHLPGGMVVQT